MTQARVVGTRDPRAAAQPIGAAEISKKRLHVARRRGDGASRQSGAGRQPDLRHADSAARAGRQVRGLRPGDPRMDVVGEDPGRRRHQEAVCEAVTGAVHDEPASSGYRSTKFRRIVAVDRLAELLLDHRRVGDRLRREVIVRVEIQLLHERARGVRRLRELLQLVGRVQIVVAILGLARAATTARRSGRAAACSRSRRRSAGSSAGSRSGTSARRSAPTPRRIRSAAQRLADAVAPAAGGGAPRRPDSRRTRGAASPGSRARPACP